MARLGRLALERAPDLPEWIDPHLLAREGWPGWRRLEMAARIDGGGHRVEALWINPATVAALEGASQCMRTLPLFAEGRSL